MSDRCAIYDSLAALVWVAAACAWLVPGCLSTTRPTGTLEEMAEIRSFEDGSGQVGGQKDRQADANGACLAAEALARVSTAPVEVVALGPVRAGRNMTLPQCHMQGLAYSARTRRVIYTCMGDDESEAGQSGYLLTTPGAYNGRRGRGWVVTHMRRVDIGGQDPWKHPSGLQLHDDVAAVAFTRQGDRNGEARIRFYRVDATGALTDLGYRLHHRRHVGALAYVRHAETLYLMGCSWDCRRLAIWRSRSGRPAGPFDLLADELVGDLVSAGHGRKPGGYNALHLTPACAGGGPMLFASYGRWLDIWEVTGLPGSPGLRKIASRRPSWHAKLFFEGMDVLPGADPYTLSVLAAPHDFSTRSECPTRPCTPQVYLLRFDLRPAAAVVSASVPPHG